MKVNLKIIFKTGLAFTEERTIVMRETGSMVRCMGLVKVNGTTISNK